jgi:hypothetical protein
MRLASVYFGDVLRDVAPCSLTEVDRRFRGAYYHTSAYDGGSEHL